MVVRFEQELSQVGGVGQQILRVRVQQPGQLLSDALAHIQCMQRP